MREATLKFENPVTFVGGGPAEREALDWALRRAPGLVAADRAADTLSGWGHSPDAVVGDMDSIGDLSAWQDGPARVVHLAEQDTTDFEKCLYAVEAPAYIGLGFLGRRMDHTLAVLHGLMRMRDKTVLLIGEREAVAMVPPGAGLEMEIEPGARVSLFPLGEVMGTRSDGLAWPVDGLRMAPGRQIGTSNIASGSRVAVGADRWGLVAMVPVTFRDKLADALGIGHPGR